MEKNFDQQESENSFKTRHIGPDADQVKKMLGFLKLESLDELANVTLPSAIRARKNIDLPEPKTEEKILKELRLIANQNQIFKSYLGMGYYGTVVPAVIQRNILENPGWYTAYTPYQAEIAQGRLEALLNFQTMICDLTGLPVANASLLDEATAGAEAMALCFSIANRDLNKCFFVSSLCHPQTIAVIQTRAEPLGINVVVGDHRKFNFKQTPCFGALVQYPATDGAIFDYKAFVRSAHETGALVTLSADLLALALLESPGEIGADIAIGSAQRFGVPLGYGGPHAAYLATQDALKRLIPGRIIGLSKDAEGRPALRLALQTREQHIRREKATSNICTAQVLLAVMASMYAVYHGPKGLKNIAERVHLSTLALAKALRQLGVQISEDPVFDTIRIEMSVSEASAVYEEALKNQMNFRKYDPRTLCISLDETTDEEDLKKISAIFARALSKAEPELKLNRPGQDVLSSFRRKTPYLTHPVFNRHHSETEMLRYMRSLESRDLSLTHSMIPLGSCTMKLNATSEMFPVSWPEFSTIHPFAPAEQVTGYLQLFSQLEEYLAAITGFDATSLQPNAGSQGEYAGLLVIRKYHQSRGQSQRNVCLIPKSAHGTNPASAAMVGMKVVAVECDARGNVDLADLKKKAQENQNVLSALMVTYPSTHGVFEGAIQEICETVHGFGGQVYMDGANMNAQIGLCKPGEFGPDVCHLNLHKTFCIPHGGGGPGMGPICVKQHLAPFLPGHPLISIGTESAVGAISAAPWGSASILPISWVYIRAMGAKGLKEATQIAILNANYVARRLESSFPVLYKGDKGFVAHECIIDLRPIKAETGIDVEDVAKRLMDYGFHAPTISFPVAGTMMIEPTESESLEELDRFCEAMISIRKEVDEIKNGKADPKNNLLKNAPHTAQAIASDSWNRSYSREKAVYPAEWTRQNKFWPYVARVDNVAGDRNLVCTCPSVEEFLEGNR